jgi:hypothetical protein
MRPKTALSIFVAAFLLSFHPAVARGAASCSAVAEDPNRPAQVEADGEQFSVGPPRDVRDCSKISISGGRVVLMFETAAGGAMSLACGSDRSRCMVPEGAKAILNGLRARLSAGRGVVAALKGGPERRLAAKRYDEESQQPEGLPSGKIYSLERAGRFDFQSLGSGPWTLVVTREPGRATLVQKSGSDPVLQLPATLFQRGGKYGWALNAGGKRFTGGFDVLGPGPAAEVERDLREAGVTAGARTRKQQIDELMVLFDHDLDHEARLLYRELGL